MSMPTKFKNYQSQTISMNINHNGQPTIALFDKLGIKQSVGDIILTSLSEDFVRHFKAAKKEEKQKLINVEVIRQVHLLTRYRNPYLVQIQTHNNKQNIIIGKYGLQGGNWGWKRLTTTLTGGAQIAGGVALIVGTGGIGAVVGGVLLSTGFSSATYGVTTDEDDISCTEYGKQVAISAATGLVTAGAGSIGTAVVGEAIKKTVVNVGVNVVSSCAGQATSTIVENHIRKDEAGFQPKKISFGDMVGSAVTGSLCSTAGGRVGKKAGKLTKSALRKVIDNDNAVKVINGGIKGTLAGVTSSSTKTILTNVYHGEQATKGLKKSVAIDGSIGAAVGAMNSARKIRIKKKAQQNKGKKPEKNAVTSKKIHSPTESNWIKYIKTKLNGIKLNAEKILQNKNFSSLKENMKPLIKYLTAFYVGYTTGKIVHGNDRHLDGSLERIVKAADSTIYHFIISKTDSEKELRRKLEEITKALEQLAAQKRVNINMSLFGGNSNFTPKAGL